ncbi:MAG: cobalamin-dependent protein [Planctomycetota bacterium]|jgi:radical SAM superfamily enzyme YgiQ (UPF0313 family)|nr:cobalamin-dependent protein [Planctomycetota bacterium]
MRVVLISANLELRPSPVYPVALGRLAGALQAAGHEVCQADRLVDGLDAVVASAAAAQPGLMVVSLRNVDDTDERRGSSYIAGYAELIAALRAVSAAPIVVGGAGFSLFPERILAACGADIGVVGPGEDTICALAANPAAIGPGIMRLGQPYTGPLVTAATWAMPSHHEPRLLRHYWQHSGMIGVQSKRGCPRRCSYCTYPQIDGRRAASAQLDDVVDELARLEADHGVRYVFFVDSVFNLNRSHELALAAAIRARGLHISWGAFFAPRGIDRAYLAALQAAGLRHVEFGTDSVCDAILQRLGKGFSVADVQQASADCHALGLACAHYLVFGSPGETAATATESVQRASELPGSVFFPFSSLRIYPGTPLYDQALADRQISAGQDLLQPHYYHSPALPRDELLAILDAWPGRPQRWLDSRRTSSLGPLLAQLRKRGAVGPLWDYALR